MALAWKAGWDKTLGSSNLPSSAVATAALRPIRRRTGTAAGSRRGTMAGHGHGRDRPGPRALADLLRVARGAPVALTDAARGAHRGRTAGRRRRAGQRPRRLRADHGVGHMRDVRVPDAELVGQQYMIVMTHSGGFGPLLPTEVSRAAMAVRLVGLTRGGSGASPAVAESLVATAQRRRPPPAAAHVLGRRRRPRRDGADRPGGDRRGPRGVPGRGAEPAARRSPARGSRRWCCRPRTAWPWSRPTGCRSARARSSRSGPWRSPTPPRRSRRCRWRRPAATRRSRCRWSPRASRSPGWWSRAGSCGRRWRAAT